MAMLQNIRFKQIRPQSNSTYDNFSGEILFNFNVGNNEVMIVDETYINVQLQLSQNGAANAVEQLADDITLSSSPVSCLFQSASLQVNNQEVAKVSEYPQSGLLYNILMNSRDKSLTSLTNDPNVPKYRYAKQIADLDVAKIRKSLVGIVPTATVANNVFKFEICGKIPMFITRDELSGNTNLQYKFQVDNSWRNQLVESITGTAIAAVTNIATPSTATKTIKVDVLDVELNVALYESSEIPRSVKSTLNYLEMFSTTRSIAVDASSDRLVVTLPRNAQAIFMCMFDSRRASVPALSPTSLYCDALRNLESYELRYGKSVFPSPQYKLNLTDEVDDLASSIRNNSRAFKEYVLSTRSLNNNLANFHDVVSWSSNPIFFHRVVKPIGDTSNELDILLTFSSPFTSNSILYVGAIYEKELNIEYNEAGLVSQVNSLEVL